MPGPYMTGAIPAPHKLAAAIPFKITAPFPGEFVTIPKRLSIWANNRYGCCVSSEEAFAKAAYSTLYGAETEIFIPEPTLVDWARKHGVLNGAMLDDVMTKMARDGIVAEDGKRYTDGPYKSVDWESHDTLAAAIYTGPVKIAVASGPLTRTHQDHNGWFGLNYPRNHRTDHCVSLAGYGTLGFLASKFGVQLPSGANAGDIGYALFTWGSIGIVDRQSMINITEEAYLRSPTTPEAPVTPPQPTPNPVPVPIDPSAPPAPVVIPCGPWNMNIIWEARHPTPPAAPNPDEPEPEESLFPEPVSPTPPATELA